MSVAFLFCSWFVGSRLCLPVTCSGGTVFDFELDVAEDTCTVFGKMNGMSSLEFLAVFFTTDSKLSCKSVSG